MKKIKKLLIHFYLIFRKFIIEFELVSTIIFRIRLFLLFKKKSKLLLLITTTKTGTHLFRFLICYYLKLSDLKEKNLPYSTLKPDDLIVDKYIPNSWHDGYLFFKFIKKPSPLLSRIGLYDIPRSHLPYLSLPWSGFKVIHTYRDILDQIVVSWATKYACNHILKKQFPTPFRWFLFSYKSITDEYYTFKNKCNNSNILRISFNQIFHNPEEILRQTLLWLGQNPDNELCKISASLTKQTTSLYVGGGEKWHRFNVKNFDYKYLENFFKKYNSTGAIGCHKDFFTNSEINKCRKLIMQYKKNQKYN